MADQERERAGAQPEQVARLRARLAELEVELGECRAALSRSSERAQATAAELRSTHSTLATATERLVTAEQLAAVGRVVGGIAHELAAQLALVGYAEAIKSRVAHDAELVGFADVLVNAQKRLTAMVDGIHDFATSAGADGPSVTERQPTELAGLVGEAVALMRYDSETRNRDISCDYQARPIALVDRRGISQVVMNLLSNAVLATKPGGAINVRVEQSSPVALISVCDQGVGMTTETLSRLGEVFFTTRGRRGSGLGIGICRQIVVLHGGTIDFSSEVGRGTTAVVRLPLLEGSNT